MKTLPVLPERYYETLLETFQNDKFAVATVMGEISQGWYKTLIIMHENNHHISRAGGGGEMSCQDIRFKRTNLGIFTMRNLE